jgi:hypothetical protein
MVVNVFCMDKKRTKDRSKVAMVSGAILDLTDAITMVFSAGNKKQRPARSRC